MKRLSHPFVVTVSALGAVACSREGTTTTTTTAPAAETAHVEPYGAGDPIPHYDDHPRLRNAADAQRRTIFRGTGITCYVELSWPKGRPRRPGEAPPQDAIPCPPEMKSAAWENCRAGTIHESKDASSCICFQMDNPPAPPSKVTCP